MDYANGKADETVARETAIRFGDRLPQPVSNIATVSDLVEAFLQRLRGAARSSCRKGLVSIAYSGRALFVGRRYDYPDDGGDLR